MKKKDPIQPKIKEYLPKKLEEDELEEIIKKEGPEKKSEVIYAQSMYVMNDLFNDPKSDQIVNAKKEISNLATHIIEDDDLQSNLINITSYDYYTYTHSVNVGVISLLLAKRIFKNSADNLEELGAGFFLHDLGKVKIDPNILNKPGKLTDEEMAIVKTHPEEGYKLLEEVGAVSEEVAIIVRQHHERNEGGGYPNDLKGDEIHDYARICTVADVYDALTAKRSYKQSKNSFDALTIMREELINHFHGDIFMEFVHMLGGKK
jgi:HD-GYP domain-containing protein (c-di-GMP phosphodiesterase class II)